MVRRRARHTQLRCQAAVVPTTFFGWLFATRAPSIAIFQTGVSTTERNDRPARCKLKDAVMLNCYGERPTNRGTLNRRDLLQIGSLSVVGLMLPDVLRLQATAAGNQTGRARDKSVIMIWMRGGPSHIDSFDMKPDAPAEIRGEFRPIQTKVPGIEICEYMPLVAGIMDH